MNLNFLRQFLNNPREIGSILPSSCFLANAMVRFAQENASSDTVFVEVGPGTGVITKPLCKSIKENQKILVLEKNAYFYDKLKQDFPTTEMILDSVTNLERLMERFGTNQSIVIVSSLPWNSFSPEDKKAGVSAIEAVLQKFPGSSLLQYSYSTSPPIQPANIRPLKLTTVLLNLPPARIWKYKSSL